MGSPGILLPLEGQHLNGKQIVLSQLPDLLLTSLKGIFDVIHLHLGSRHPEYAFMLQPWKDTGKGMVRKRKPGDRHNS